MKTNKKEVIENLQKQENLNNEYPLHYRYEYNISTSTTFGENTLYDVSIRLIIFKVIKETPKGYWITENTKEDYYNLYGKHFVLINSRKRFAYPTKEEAFNSLKKRAERRMKFVRRDFDRAEAVLQAIKKKEDES